VKVSGKLDAIAKQPRPKHRTYFMKIRVFA
jgi:hypothetical protein